MIFFYMTQNSKKKNKIFVPGIAFGPEIRVSDQIKHAIGRNIMKFGPPGATFSPVPSPKLPFFDQCFLYFAILGPLNPCFDQLDRYKIKKYSYLSYLHIFIYI